MDKKLLPCREKNADGCCAFVAYKEKFCCSVLWTPTAVEIGMFLGLTLGLWDGSFCSHCLDLFQLLLRPNPIQISILKLLQHYCTSHTGWKTSRATRTVCSGFSYPWLLDHLPSCWSRLFPLGRGKWGRECHRDSSVVCSMVIIIFHWWVTITLTANQFKYFV